VLLPIQADVSECGLDQISHAVGDARADHVVAGLVLLEHAPHGTHIVPGIAPIPAGVEVAKANDGAQALQRIAEQSPDIVFMDVRMPVMDGLSAVRRLREQWRGKRIVCVAITASGLLRQRSFYIDAGFDDCIGKPFRFETVLACMARHLGVELEYEAVPEACRGATRRTAGVGAVHLPEALRERLLAAARINALTEIEALIAELKGLDASALAVAEKLEELLSEYDTEGITAFVSRIPARGE